MALKKGKSRSVEEVRKAVFGTTRSHTNRPSPAPYLSELSKLALWKGIWTRTDKLDMRSRRLLCIAVLTAIGAHEELEMHVEGALRNGDLSVEELQEAAAHLAVYCGWPRAHWLPNITLKVSQRLKESEKPD